MARAILGCKIAQVILPLSHNLQRQPPDDIASAVVEAIEDVHELSVTAGLVEDAVSDPAGFAKKGLKRVFDQVEEAKSNLIDRPIEFVHAAVNQFGVSGNNAVSVVPAQSAKRLRQVPLRSTGTKRKSPWSTGSGKRRDAAGARARRSAKRRVGTGPVRRGWVGSRRAGWTAPKRGRYKAKRYSSKRYGRRSYRR